LLLERLSNGWRAGASDVARDLVGRWETAFGCAAEIKDTRDSWLRFNCDLRTIRLRGTSESQCLLLAGRDDARAAVEEFWAKARSPGKAVFVIALNGESCTAVRAAIPEGRCVVLNSEAAARILGSGEPAEHLKVEIRKQIPLERLIPFDAEHAAEGHMFFGRTGFLARLTDEDTTSFAIAGPSRIGKTSLLKRYREHLVKTKSPEQHSHYYIDLMRCGSKNDDDVARFLVNSIDSSHKNHRLTCDRLEITLGALKMRYEGPIGLLLDEVDEYVGSTAFQYLSHAAKNGYCRLLMGGKGELLKKMLEETNPFQCRMHVLRLEPLDENEAVELVFGPFRDLGFVIREPGKVRDSIFRWTGNLPHLLQFYGHRLCELMIDRRVQTLDIAMVEEVRDALETFTYFSDPLFKAKDPKLRFIALSMLDLGHRPYGFAHIHQVLTAKGLTMTVDELRDKLNELVILNVLAWTRGAFQVANESLIYYARETGFMSLALCETKQSLGIR